MPKSRCRSVLVLNVQIRRSGKNTNVVKDRNTDSGWPQKHSKVEMVSRCFYSYGTKGRHKSRRISNARWRPPTKVNYSKMGSFCCVLELLPKNVLPVGLGELVTGSVNIFPNVVPGVCYIRHRNKQWRAGKELDSWR